MLLTWDNVVKYGRDIQLEGGLNMLQIYNIFRKRFVDELLAY
jgi:hypothetical protein